MKNNMRIYSVASIVLILVSMAAFIFFELYAKMTTTSIVILSSSILPIAIGLSVPSMKPVNRQKMTKIVFASSFILLAVFILTATVSHQPVFLAYSVLYFVVFQGVTLGNSLATKQVA